MGPRRPEVPGGANGCPRTAVAPRAPWVVNSQQAYPHHAPVLFMVVAKGPACPCGTRGSRVPGVSMVVLVPRDSPAFIRLSIDAPVPWCCAGLQRALGRRDVSWYRVGFRGVNTCRGAAFGLFKFLGVSVGILVLNGSPPRFDWSMSSVGCQLSLRGGGRFPSYFLPFTSSAALERCVLASAHTWYEQLLLDVFYYFLSEDLKVILVIKNGRIFF